MSTSPLQVFDPSMFVPAHSLGGNTSGWQGEMWGNATADVQNRNNLIRRSSGLIDKTGGITDFLSGSPTDSPLYKSLLSQSRESIGNSYDSAVRNTRASAASRGFGYASPNVEGTEAGIRGEEAGAMAHAPSEALQGTIAPMMDAARLRTSQAGILGEQAGMYNTSQLGNLGDITSLQQARMSKSVGMTQAIAQIIAATEQAAGAAAAGKGG